MTITISGIQARQAQARQAKEDSGGIAVTAGSASVDAVRFRATLSAVAGFASKDSARPILTGVRVEYSDGYLTFIATDSHRLAVFTVPAVVTGEPEPVLLSPDTVAAILALVKPGIIGRNPGPVTLQLSALGGFRFDNGAGGQTTGEGIEGAFPNYRGLIPRFQESGGAVALNPGYLADIAKAFKVLLAGRDTPVQVSTDPHTNDRPALPGGFTGRPVRFTVEDTELWPTDVPAPVAVLMPVRVR